jgi:outer membrane receptor protein involved in Fe transport
VTTHSAGAKLRRPNAPRALVLALAQALSYSAALVPLAYAAPAKLAQPVEKPGTVLIFGYAAGALSSDFSVEIEGKKWPANKGAIKLDLAAGIHDLRIFRGDTFVFALPVFFDSEFKRSLLLTLDKPGSVDYVLQDTTSAEVLDAGSKILPGMEASIGGAVMVEPPADSSALPKPLANALVRLDNTDNYAVTDAQGKFKFADLPAGQYTLMVMAPDFEPIEPITFTLAPKESAERSVSLAAILETLSEIKVTAAGVSAQTQATEEERSSATVSEVVNAEQIKRGGDSEASGALKRVTGLSVVGGKFIYVRGMGERYSSVLLNGAQIPSPDPTRRVVPLDLFPTEVLDSVVVQKSYSADMPGEFGGGTVMLRTKEAARKPFLKLSAGISAQDGTSFENGLRYRGGNRDWLGFDQVRELPTALSSLTANNRPLSAQNATPAQLEQAGESLAALGFNTRESNIGPNGNFTAAGGGGWEFDDTKFSILGAARIANTWDSNEEIRRSYGASNNDQLVLVSDVKRNVTERQGTLTGFLNGVLTFGDGQRIQATSMLLRQSLDQAQIDEGYKESPDDVTKTYELEWNENSLISNQLSGEHYFSEFHELGLNWQITDARAARESPAKRRYIYQRVDNEFFFSRGSDSNQIVYEDLDDASREYRLGMSLPWAASDDSLVTFAAGIGRLERDRDSDLRRFTFSARSSAVVAPAIGRLPLDQILTPQNIGPNGYQLAEVTRSLDNYTASQTLDSYFLNADWTFGEHWRFIGGVRREANDQKVATFDLNTPTAGRIESNAKANKFLPALAATYIFDEAQQQVRLSYGRSLSRPDFREYSPAPFLDPILDIESFGNPRLKATQIDNLDLRWERYFEGDESVSVALFYKDFKLPIERVSIAGTGGLLSYENAESARNFGVELDGFMGLGRLSESLESFFVSANVSALESKVELGSAGSIQTSRSRPLQGQSKYLVNAQFGYKPEGGAWEATALYNVAGRRIAQVGAIGLADIYEQPFHQLDATARYRLAPEWSLGFRLKNLLDETVEFTQSGAATRSYKPGREIGFSVEWTPKL